MKPEVSDILIQSAMRLMSEIAPALGAGYGQGSAGTMAVLMMLAAQEFERGADIRAAENADFRAVFRECIAAVGDTALREALEKAAQETDASLAISQLNRANEELRRLMIALHAHVELRDGAEARHAERRIWTALRASAERRIAPLAHS